ncbi:MAG: protein kinase [Candidatus Competibacter sp.]|nr:protein kinase [Candidatus Competibacter sp.]
MEIPGYTILNKIGQGGMATVYLAIQESLDRQVALKVMHSTRVDEENFPERFLKEGRIIAQLQHPRIITVYDFGSHGLYNYFSMEFLSGGTLAQQIEQGLSLERAVDIMKLISGALAYAHGRGVIHRDIKPQNVLFRQDGTPVLSDFGIAKLVDTDDTQLTAPGLAIGSPVYMSPEQITGKKLDNRTDLYSLGIVFYEMLAKQPPFRSDDITSIAMMHCTQPVPRLPAGFGQIQPVLHKLLAKKPSDRFENADQLIQALDQTGTRPSFYTFIQTTRIVQSLNTSTFLKKSLLAGGLSLLAVATGSAVYLTVSRRAAPPETGASAVELPPAVADRSIIASNYEQLAIQHFQNRELGQSLELIKLGLQASPNDDRLLALRQKVENDQEASRLLEQARQDERDGAFERSRQRVEEGLRLVPDQQELLALRDTLQARTQDRQRQADRLLSEAHARWQAGDLDGGLKLIEQGLQQVPAHPELLTLQAVIQARLNERQRAPQLLAEARELFQRGELDESRKRIEQGLGLVSEQPDLLRLQDQVKAALETRNRVSELLRDCADRFPMDRLASKQGGEILACYKPIVALSSEDGRARAKLKQIADRYADLTAAAIGKADFQLAEDYLAQLGQIRPDHPRLANLDRTLRTKREQAALEARQQTESEARRQAAEEAKRRTAEEAKRQESQKAFLKPTPDRLDTRTKSPATTALKPEVILAPKQSNKLGPEFTAPSHQRKSKSNCTEALLKAQLGEPLSVTEQEECRP